MTDKLGNFMFYFSYLKIITPQDNNKSINIIAEQEIKILRRRYKKAFFDYEIKDTTDFKDFILNF